MRPGPPPQPPELRVLLGNPGHRRIPKSRPRPKAGASCPVTLSPAARLEWRRLLPQLLTLGLLTRVDRAALAAYCEAWADFVWATDAIQKQGYVSLAGNGTQIPHPAVAIKHRAMDRVRKFAAEFGFTPAARMRPLDSGAGEDQDDDTDRFFNGPCPVAAPPAAPPRRPRRR